MIYPSFCVHVNWLQSKNKRFWKQLTQKLEVDTAEIEHDLSIIMIVGEKMKSQVGVTATAAKSTIRKWSEYSNDLARF